MKTKMIQKNHLYCNELNFRQLPYYYFFGGNPANNREKKVDKQKQYYSAILIGF